MEGKEFRSIRLKHGYSNNMGVYTHARLMELEPRIKKFPKSIDKNTAIRWEDTFHGAGQLAFINAPIDFITAPVIDVYGQGQPRRVEHYAAIGIKKYKSHWGQGIVGDKP